MAIAQAAEHLTEAQIQQNLGSITQQLTAANAELEAGKASMAAKDQHIYQIDTSFLFSDSEFVASLIDFSYMSHTCLILSELWTNRRPTFQFFLWLIRFRYFVEFVLLS